MNTIMFTHNDLDGVGCGILHKAAFGIFAKTFYCSYHNVDDVIVSTIKSIQEKYIERPFLIISDLGIKPETAELVDAYEGGKVLLDHHVSNKWLADEYEWAQINEHVCGTYAVYEYFGEIPEKFGDFVLHVDDYDRWVHKYPKSKELNRLLYIVGIKRFEERFLSNPSIEFDETERLLLELEDEAIDNYVLKVDSGMRVYTTIGDKRFGIGFAERFHSEVAHELLDRRELDAIALIDINYKKVSFRSKPDFDVGSIAERLGGGGHKNAAGATFGNYKRIVDFHGSKYPLHGVMNNLENMIFSLFWSMKTTFENIENEEIAKGFGGFHNERS